MIRPLHEISADIRRCWRTPHYAAAPYLDAMDQLTAVTDRHQSGPADQIVRHFLNNARDWRGDDARRIKHELTELLATAPKSLSMASGGWRATAVRATHGTQLGAILAAALGLEVAPPCYNGKASITDGFLIGDFTAADGARHTGAFIGSVADLELNIFGLSRHLNLSDADAADLLKVFQGWIGLDYRARPGLRLPEIEEE
jgi:hypothetical protein